MAKYLLSGGSVGLFSLSGKISPDLFEIYFGQQRARGRNNENPNLQLCRTMQQKSIATDPVCGNCDRKKRLYADIQPEIDCTPLPMRKRKALKD